LTESKVFELKLKSKSSEVSKVEALLSDLFLEYKVDDEYSYQIMIATTEAINNAIEHGNEFDLKKEIHLNIQINQHKIKISIRDHGKGFVYNDLPDPLAPENLLKSSGRGVFLVHQLMENVHYTNTGNGMLLNMEKVYGK
jgi:serine/threonine-protein kinase RsbW